MKDRFGHVCGEAGGGVYGTSQNGIDWKLQPGLTYSRSVVWENGQKEPRPILKDHFC